MEQEEEEEDEDGDSIFGKKRHKLKARGTFLDDPELNIEMIDHILQEPSVSGKKESKDSSIPSVTPKSSLDPKSAKLRP